MVGIGRRAKGDEYEQQVFHCAKFLIQVKTATRKGPTDS